MNKQFSIKLDEAVIHKFDNIHSGLGNSTKGETFTEIIEKYVDFSENPVNTGELTERLTVENQKLSEDFQKISEENRKLSEEYQQLSEENQSLKTDCEKLSNKDLEINRLTEENQKISEENRQLSEENQKLTEVNPIREKIGELRWQYLRFSAKVATERSGKEVSAMDIIDKLLSDYYEGIAIGSKISTPSSSQKQKIKETLQKYE